MSMINWNEVAQNVYCMVKAANKARMYGDAIAKTIVPEGNDWLYDLLQEIQDGDMSDEEEILSELKEIANEYESEGR